ncbi:MAG TPA: glycosyltransferase family 4 protein [Bryobacteraceae bacterium]|nr:glycosyltransferase family 4 protein [Bryobacteraceae bacterium]
MRIAMLMSLGASWAREAALRFSELGHDVHAVDFDTEVLGNYLRGREDIHAGAVAKLRARLGGIHLIPGTDISQWRYLRQAPRFRAICRSIDPDVLLSLWGGGFAMMSYASGIRPYAVYVCGGDILRVSGMQKAVSRHVLARAAAVFANGKYFGEKTRAFAPRASVHTAYLGVDPDRFRPAAAPPSPVVIICTRGFTPVYNNSYLIEAIALLPADVPAFRVVFTSAGPCLGETRELADRILSPERRASVEFFNGVSDEGIVEQLRSAHVYTSVSRYDGTSISLLEALACGLFPVLSDIPPNREWIDSNVANGILVPFDRPADYARSLQQAIVAASWRNRVALFNRQLILDRADGRKTMAFVASTLEQAIGLRN